MARCAERRLLLYATEFGMLLHPPAWCSSTWVMEEGLNLQAVALEAAVARRRIVPGDHRTSPAQLELCLAVPAGTRSLTLSVDFQKAFLTVFEHPPDASR